jgi:mono/diheme cytochrome c family protein
MTAALIAALALTACRGTEIEDSIAKVSWFGNMRNQAAVEPYEEAPRMPPDGTVPVGASVPAGAFPNDYETVVNPIAVTEASLERGKEQYDIFCAVCHGPEGRGGGNIEGPFPRGLINQLDTERARDYTDGYLFGMIAVGRGLMPAYRRIPQVDRWHIVNYVRQLQADGNGG